MLGVSAEMRNELHACGTRSNERDALVRQLVQATVGIAAGVVIVPTCRVKDVSLEIPDAWDIGQLGPVVRTLSHDHESGPDVVAAVGGQPPALDALVPPH